MPSIQLKWPTAIILFRIALLVIGGLAIYYFPYRPDFAYTSWKFISGSGLPEWLTAWANFDGVHYLNIALQGYSDQARFLPFYPAIIGFLVLLLGLVIPGLNTATAELMIGLLISVMSATLALYFLVELLKLDLPKTSILKVSLTLVSFPTAFFLWAIYTEGTFLLLSILAIYLARKEKWWLASLVASLLTITRLPGIFIVVPLGIEWVIQHPIKMRPKDIASYLQKHWQNLASFGLIPLPLLAYAYYNFQKWGSGLYFVTAHGELANSRSVSTLVFPLQTLGRYFKILWTLPPSIYEWWVSLLELGSFGLAGVLLWLGWRQKIRTSYLWYAVALLLLPSFSGTFSGLPRYLLVVFPFLIILNKLPRKWWYSYLVTGFILQMILMGLFLRGYFVA